MECDYILHVSRPVSKDRILVTDIMKPMNLALILKQSQCNTMYRGIPPSLVKESTLSIQIIEITLISFASPKIQIPNFKV